MCRQQSLMLACAKLDTSLFMLVIVQLNQMVTVQYKNTLFVRPGNYSADRHLQHDRNKALNIRSRVDKSHIYSINRRLFIPRFLSNLALRIEMAEGKKDYLDRCVLMLGSKNMLLL